VLSHGFHTSAHGFPVPNQIKQLKHKTKSATKIYKKRQKKKQKASKGDVFLKAKVAAQY